MNQPVKIVDLSGMQRAIDFDAQVARNREIIKALGNTQRPQVQQRVKDNRGLWYIPQSQDYLESFYDA